MTPLSPFIPNPFIVAKAGTACPGSLGRPGDSRNMESF
jgi:hypothetical protein